MKRIIVLGGGLSGLAAAYYFSEKKVSFSLFETDSDLGGLCRTVSDNGFNYDYTGHLLHLAEDKTKKLAKQLMGDNLQEHIRNSWIFSNNVYTRYPFQCHTYGLPINVRKDVLFGYLKAYYNNHLSSSERSSGDPGQGVNEMDSQKLEISENDRAEYTFVDWVNNNLGSGIGKHFMFPYNKKLWSVDPNELTETWLRGYVPKPDLKTIIKGTFSDKNELVGYNAKFYYPKKGGIASLVKAFAKKIKGEINLNSKIESISIKNKKIKINSIKDPQDFDYLISSAPLKELVLNIIEDAPSEIREAAKALRYNTVLNINLGVRRIISDKHWIYFPEDKYIFYRAGFCSNFADDVAPSGSTAIYTEISFPHDISETDYKKYIDLTIADLKKCGILKDNDKIDSICPLKLSPAYIIYDKARDKNVAKILNFLKTKNIYSVGRYGKWEYSAMENAILEALEAAEGIFNG